MLKLDSDLAIVGSGFGGTLLALVAQRLGYSVALLERGRHPRFAIGESSTPLADFKLARIADRFGLDWLKPFAKYGTWKATYPDVACGLKRGFSFFRHEQHRNFAPTPTNDNALLVAASPDDGHADTHWFRADFDAYLVKRAVDANIAYFDQFALEALNHDAAGWRVVGTRFDESIALRARFIVDATGDGQLLGRALGLKSVPSSQLHAQSRALYSHFTGVTRWHDVLEMEHGRQATAEHLFPCDAAALHQIIDHGWMWVLRFNNGITSAGFSLDPDVYPFDADEAPENEWRRLLAAYPSLGRQFREATPIRPFTRTSRLQRRWARAAGSDWAMLPHAAGFLDAWLSPGIAQTLYAVNRLGGILAEGPRCLSRAELLADYSRTVLGELAWVDEITSTCFACFDRFEILAPVTMLYFAAAITCEERERAGKAGPDDAFLLADDAAYRAIAAKAFRQARKAGSWEGARFAAEVGSQLERYGLGELCDPRYRNMVPFIGTN
jgi:FADH2 O2-dependent halogenase